MMKMTKARLSEYRVKCGTSREYECSPDEVAEIQKHVQKYGDLPEDVSWDKNLSTVRYYRQVPVDLSEHEIQEFLQYEQAIHIRTIRNVAIFFAVVLAFVVTFSIVVVLVLGNGIAHFMSSFRF